jgi:hypothetical protein
MCPYEPALSQIVHQVPSHLVEIAVGLGTDHRLICQGGAPPTLPKYRSLGNWQGVLKCPEQGESSSVLRCHHHE